MHTCFGNSKHSEDKQLDLSGIIRWFEVYLKYLLWKSIIAILKEY